MCFDKKIVACILTVFLFLNALYAKETGTAALANRKTAERCLKLSEKCLLDEKWEEALAHAETGLSYDDGFSDLYYIKAAAMMNMGSSRRQVIDKVEIAFEKNDWIGYNKSGARILYADLLSDICEYEKSLEIIDSEPFIYSSDAEFIRVKDYYRIGTAATLEKARDKVFSARRIYPEDQRFSDIFFMFEGAFKNAGEINGKVYKIPDIVKRIAADYIKRMPYIQNPAGEIDLIATFFASPDEQIRLLKAYTARGVNSPLYPVVAIKTGLLQEDEAVSLFFSLSDGSVNLDVLELFAGVLKDETAVSLFRQYLESYSGILNIDMNLNFENELSVVYERGRAKEIYYDAENDGVEDLHAFCDFGTPEFILYGSPRMEIEYGIYPAVAKIKEGKNSEMNFPEDTVFTFADADMKFSPFDMLIPHYLSEKNIAFYIPFISSEIGEPVDHLLMEKANSVSYPVSERKNARIVYTLAGGNPVSAAFWDGDIQYAWCDMNSGFPFTRYVDYDNDEFYETYEIFNNLNNTGFRIADTATEDAFISRIFGNAGLIHNIYLEKLLVDANADTIFEFAEEYLTDGGRISSWDLTSDGKWNIQYRKFPAGDSLFEESAFRLYENASTVTVGASDGRPVFVEHDGKRFDVYPGFTDNLFWVGESYESEDEQKIVAEICRIAGKSDADFDSSLNIFENGAVSMIEINRTEEIKIRYYAIKVDKKLYLWTVE